MLHPLAPALVPILRDNLFAADRTLLANGIAVYHARLRTAAYIVGAVGSAVTLAAGSSVRSSALPSVTVRLVGAGCFAEPAPKTPNL